MIVVNPRALNNMVVKYRKQNALESQQEMSESDWSSRWNRAIAQRI